MLKLTPQSESERGRLMRLTVMSAVAALVVSVAGCGSSDTASTETVEEVETTEAVVEPTKVRMALSSFQDVCSVYVGIEKGYYDEAGINLEIQRTDWPGANELGVGNQVEMWTTSDADIIQQNDSGVDTTLAFPLFYFGGGGMMYDPNRFDWKSYDEFFAETNDAKEATKRTLEQAKGKKVGVSSGGGEYATFVELVSFAGLNVKDFQVVDLAQEELPPALISGSIDAQISGIPQRLAVQREGYETLIDQRALPSTIVHAGFGAKRSWVDANPEVAAAIQGVILKTLDYIEKNPDETFPIISKCLEEGGTTVPPEDLKGVWNVMEFFPNGTAWYEEKVETPGGQFYWKDRFETVVKNLRTEDKISADFSVPLEDLNYGLKTVAANK
jgi:NitT/TauT family transport system substrate-binding protein